MSPNFFIVSLVLYIQILTSVGQSAIKNYLHITGSPYSAGLNMPTVGYTRPAVPSGLTALPSGGLAQSSSGTVPNNGLSALSALASLPGLLQALASSTSSQSTQKSAGVPALKNQALQPKSSSTPSVPTKQNAASTTQPGGLDSSVLNNLAVALQLLIVSNILNSNLPENEANPIYEMLETAKSIPVSLSQTQSNNCPSSCQLQGYQEPNFAQYSEPFLPNANFVGTSGFAEATVSDPYIKPLSRNSYQLMSPYEALGPNSPFADPILASPFGSIMSSKKDFHSPYIMMDSDPFNMNDLF